MTTENKKRGRPQGERPQGKRKPLSFKTTDSLREKLDKAAADSGRSLAQEVEHRLEMSLLNEGLFNSLLRDQELTKQVLMLVRLKEAVALLFGSFHKDSVKVWSNSAPWHEPLFGRAMGVIAGFVIGTNEDHHSPKALAMFKRMFGDKASSYNKLIEGNPLAKEIAEKLASLPAEYINEATPNDQTGNAEKQRASETIDAGEVLGLLALNADMGRQIAAHNKKKTDMELKSRSLPFAALFRSETNTGQPNG